MKLPSRSSGIGRRGSESPARARRIAFEVLLRVDQGGAYASRALDAAKIHAAAHARRINLRDLGTDAVGLSLDETALSVKPRKRPPHEFVLEALAALPFHTRPMFGCLAVYVEDKIVLILRDKGEHTADNGVWLATTEEHHESLRGEFPNMRSVQIFGKPVTAWQVLPADAPDFERTALRA